MDKSLARRYALDLRKNENIIIASNNVIEALIKSKVLNDFKRVGIYYPIGREIDIMPLINHYENIEFYLPKTEENLSFIKYDGNLINGPFHTKEPIGVPIERDLIECFLIPCVAISADLKRVGYGKGYYDLYLKDYKGLKIGICYKDASNLDIEMDSFDLRLDKIYLGWLYD